MHGSPWTIQPARPSVLSLAILLLAACLGTTLEAQTDRTGREIKITGDRLGGFVLPVLPVESDIRLNGIEAWTWRIDDTLRIQLQGDVQIDVGGYAFTAAEARPDAAGSSDQQEKRGMWPCDGVWPSWP